MVDTCQEKISIPTSFFYRLKSRSLYHFLNLIVRGGVIMYRRLINLIYADWLPHDLASSWSCPDLIAGVSVILPIPIVPPGVLQP